MIKLRASEIGNFISKSGKQTDDVRAAFIEKMCQIKYGYTESINSKYFDKGIACESIARAYLAKKLEIAFLPKYSKKLENEYITGTPDCIHNGIVYDIKNAYDCVTFEKAKLSHVYEWQLKAYMYLLGFEKASLVYALCDMPDFLLAEEERKFCYANRIISIESDEFREAWAKYVSKFVYRPDVNRIRMFDVVLNDDDIKTIQKAVVFFNNYFF